MLRNQGRYVLGVVAAVGTAVVLLNVSSGAVTNSPTSVAEVAVASRDRLLVDATLLPDPAPSEAGPRFCRDIPAEYRDSPPSPPPVSVNPLLVTTMPRAGAVSLRRDMYGALCRANESRTPSARPCACDMGDVSSVSAIASFDSFRFHSELDDGGLLLTTTAVEENTTTTRRQVQSESSGGRHHRRFTSIVERFSDNSKSPFCYYRIQNACVLQGQLTLFGPNAARLPKLRLCNELRQKIRLHFRVVSDAPAQPPQAPLARTAHVAACWQFYGYHLMECLASCFALQAAHDAKDADMFLYNHAVSLPEVSRNHFSHQLVLGNPLSFFDSKENRGGATTTARTAAAKSPYWLLWGQNVEDPARIREVQRGPFERGASVCYRQVFVGQPHPGVLNETHRRVHAAFLRSRLLNLTSQRAATFASMLDEGGSRERTGMPDNEGGTLRRLRFTMAELIDAWLSNERRQCTNGSDRRAVERSISPATTLRFRVVIANRRVGHMQGDRRILNLDETVRAVAEEVVQDADALVSEWRQEDQEGPDSSRPVVTCHEGAMKRDVAAQWWTKSARQRSGGSPSAPVPSVGVGLPSHDPQQRALICVVDWAALPMEEQFLLAYHTQVLIATHGGGNTWITFMRPPQAVLIELWHSAYVPRNVFLSLAAKLGVHYLAHLRSEITVPGNFMHQPVLVNTTVLRRQLSRALNFLASA